MKREFDAKLRKVGNSFVVTIPAIIVQKFKLKENNFLTVFMGNLTKLTKSTKSFPKRTLKDNKKINYSKFSTTKINREFDAKLRKVGNSFVVTVPALTVQRFKLKANQFIDISIKND